jgi:ribonucleoside-diphosphate reductase alpha chain
MVASEMSASGSASSRPLLNELGEKIFLDRYALKDMTKKSLSVGDLVIACVNQKTRQREIGTVSAIRGDRVAIDLRDGTSTEQGIEDVDKPLETTPESMMDRVARGIASIELSPERKEEWEARFRWLLDEWRFVPGGRILNAAGTDQKLTFFNCYVVPSPKDSRRGIVETLNQMMEIMSRGGGVGINLSSLRPRHAYVKGVNGRSSGSVSWGGLYSFVTGLIEQGGSRRGALMLITNVWHPDVLDFIDAKREAGKITNANISVGITDAFMEAMEKDADWPLVFPDPMHPSYNTEWDGDLDKWKAAGRPVVVHKIVKAREVWNRITASAWSSAEPGVFFIDRANKQSNSWYFSQLVCTNPCGEQPLPAWGICNLGAINLGRFSTESGEVAWDELRRAVRYSVRFLDNVIDATPYFFEENQRQQQAERRVGLGLMGLAELLVRCRVRYGSEESIQFIDKLGQFIATEAYLASADNAAEKGSFPLLDREKLLQSGYMQGMPENVRNAVREKGLRNVTLLTVAPTGTTGTMVNTSTGVEPYFSWTYFRKSRLGVHEERVSVVEDWEKANPGKPLPPWFVSAMELTPTEHVQTQAALQRWIDSAISKTCNVPEDYSIEQTRELYELMYKLGCKGGTIYRDGSRDEQVLNLKKDDEPKKDAKAQDHAHAQNLWNQPKIRPRPKVSRGMTVQKPSPLGSIFVTVNDDDQGEPLEIFLAAGKAGSDITAMAEAMGRLMSLVLRVASPLSPMERLKEIQNQLGGIGGSRQHGFGKNLVRSLPDAIALAIEEVVKTREPSSATEAVEGEPKVEPVQLDLLPKVHADLCPNCGEAAFIREEGCMHCTSCGHSQC